MGAMPTTRSYVGRYFALMLDGYDDPGYLKSVEGGSIKGDLIAQQVGGMPWRVKHINNPTIEAITVSVPLSLSNSFMDWVKKSWNGQVERRSGSIISYDHDFKPVHELSFTNALVLETVFPTLDGQSKEPGYITIKFQPETATHVTSPSGSKIPVVSPTIQTQWSPANFRLDVDGLDTKRVAKIDSLTIKQNVKPFTVGPEWMYQIEPTTLEYPNITFYISEFSAKPFYDWHNQFVQTGANDPSNEKTGAIVFLDNSLQKELLTIDLFALGCVNILPDKADAAGGDGIRRVKVEMYCEEMKFEYST